MSSHPVPNKLEEDTKEAIQILEKPYRRKIFNSTSILSVAAGISSYRFIKYPVLYPLGIIPIWGGLFSLSLWDNLRPKNNICRHPILKYFMKRTTPKWVMMKLLAPELWPHRYLMYSMRKIDRILPG